MRLNSILDCLFQYKWNIYIILTLTAIIVLPNISRESLEHDELWTAAVTSKEISLKVMIFEYILKDVHPPLYYVILHYWGIIFGNNEFEIRILSYLFIVSSLFGSYLLLKTNFTNRLAVFFVALSSFTPGVLFYAQQLRMYALLYALTNLASILFIIFILKIKDGKTIEKKFIISYFFVGLLICYTHFIGYLVVLSLSVVILSYSLYFKRKRDTINLLITSSCIGLFALMWLFIHFYYGGLGAKTQGNFTVVNDLSGTIMSFSTLLAANKYGVFIIAILSIPFFFPLNNLVASIKKHFVLIFPIVLLLTCAILISFNTPIITFYNLIVIIPLLNIFLSFIFNELYDTKKSYIFSFIAALFVFGSYSSYTYKKQNWRDAAQYIKNNFDCNTCKVPINEKRLIVSSYYFGSKYTFSTNGPKVQRDCELIYIDGHTNEFGIRSALKKNNITIPYKILNFGKVFVVVKS